METKTERIENSITVVVGGRNTGITTENKKHIARYIKDRKRNGRDYRVLIIDFQDEYKGSRIKYEDLSSFSNKTVILGSLEMTTEERIDLIRKMCYDFTNGLLVIDNYFELFKELRMADMIGLICCNRNKALDVLLVCGDRLDKVNPKIMENCTYLRFHQYVKTPEKIKLLDMPDAYDVALNVLSVQYKSSFEFIVLDKGNREIFGCTKQEFINGMKLYLTNRVNQIKTLRQLSALHFNFAVKYSERKHIPISNIERKYLSENNFLRK